MCVCIDQLYEYFIISFVYVTVRNVLGCFCFLIGYLKMKRSVYEDSGSGKKPLVGVGFFLF